MLDEMGLISIFSTFHPTEKEYTFFSSAHETFSMMEQILGNKSNLINLRKIEIISSIFSDNNAMRLDILQGKKNCKKHKHMETKQHISK